MGLRKGQKELVEQYREGFCAVPAIPGGGKTHCLSLWAVEMIAQGLHKPGKILIVTYMNTAVNNFKQRISSELQKRGINGTKDYFVSTIHSLCLQIIKEKPDLIIANEEFEIIDEVNKHQMVGAAIDEWRRKNEDRFRGFLDETGLSATRLSDAYKKWQERFGPLVLGIIGDFKIRGISAWDAKEKSRQLADTSILKCAAEIYEFYDRRLKMGGFLDFDDMLYSAKKLLEEDEVLREKYRKKFTFVCEDEAQDSNLIQSEILTMIADGNLLRVGDSNQAICGTFTNSDFTLFKDFCEMPETTVYNITQSSRNTKEIINLANHFVSFVREEHPVPECRNSLLAQYIEPVPDDDERRNPTTPQYGIKAAVFDTWNAEAEGVVKQACHMLKNNPGKTMAILVPSAWRTAIITDMLDARGITYEQLDNTSRERNKTVRALGRIIDFIATPESGEKLALMMNECLIEEVDSEAGENSEKIREARVQKAILEKFLASYPVEKLLYPVTGEIDTADIPVELLKSQVWKAFCERIELVKELLEFPDTLVEKLILYISEKLEFDREERAIAQKIAGDVRYLMSQDPHWRLSDLAFELLKPKNMFNYFAGVVWELKGYEPKPGVVTIATYHKSKGLEWDTIFLTGLNNEEFPVALNDRFKGEYWFLKQEFRNPGALSKSEMQALIDGNEEEDCILKSKIETISEKARLLYVGITRAKQHLFLSGFHSNRGKRNESPASAYLLELKRFIDRQSQELSDVETENTEMEEVV